MSPGVWAFLALNCCLIFGQLNTVGSTKIISRWAKLKDPNARCWVLFPKQVTQGNYVLVDTFLPLANSLDYWLKKGNCSLKSVDYLVTGSPNATGSYDGYLGMVQRNEYDFVYLAVRPDSLPFEPGKLTPPIISADVTILSRKNETERSEKREVTSFLNLDICVYVYTLVICFFILPIFLLYVHLRGKLMSTNVTLMYKEYIANCCRVFVLLLDQEQFQHKSLPARILIFSASLFTLFAVFGLLLNTVGADLIVKKSPPTIDSLDDLLNSRMQPVIIRRLFEYELIKASPSGSKLNKVWNRMNENLNVSLFDFDESNTAQAMPTVMNLFKKLVSSKVALLLPQSSAIYVHWATCVLKKMNEFADIAKRTHVASQLFAPGMITGLMADKIHPYPEKVLTYLFRTIHETSIFTSLADQLKPKIFTMTGDARFKYDSKVLTCLEKTKFEGGEKFSPFSALDLIRLFEMWAFFCIFSCAILILEVIYHRNFGTLIRRRPWSVLLLLQFTLSYWAQLRKRRRSTKSVSPEPGPDEKIQEEMATSNRMNAWV